ncbi:DUF4190 domain-containing protein [Skermania piniformis]|uniref:DUF4190 domain-containing protein n=1 Tax=Skermania pinensis TaxID=39122 RepID=A0ABX8SAD1_9ACTN|nr:DUF4190 domain-containing protein [Skermania piniformis]QXQ14127.1 DUF4190 domain-containing protein [Skermania piniformis]
MAIASFIASCVGLVTCGLGSIIGVVLGFVAWRQIQQTGQGGRGLAIAGLVIGGVLLLCYVVFFVWTVSFAAATGA